MEQTNIMTSPGSDGLVTVSMNVDNASAPMKMYYVDCSGTGYVILTHTRLNVMFEKMPTLRLLPVGYPKVEVRAKESPAEEVHRHPGKGYFLWIPRELGVSKSSFILLVGCILGHVQLPRPGVYGARFWSVWRPLLQWEVTKIWKNESKIFDPNQ
jgi:hypothetical protein